MIASAQNSHLKLVRKLARRRERDREQAVAVEGEDLVGAALDAGVEPRFILIDAEREPALQRAQMSCPVLPVEPRLLAEVADLAHPPRVIGVFERPLQPVLATAWGLRRAPWLLLDGVSDPGNVGTILRTVAALGAGGVMTMPGTADVWGSKATRASMGACFRVAVVPLGAAGADDGSGYDDGMTRLEQELADMDDGPARVVALDPSGEAPLWRVGVKDRDIVVVGSERSGVSAEWLEHADVVAQIPQDERVDSVNAAVAASLALYEWARCRAGAAT